MRSMEPCGHLFINSLRFPFSIQGETRQVGRPEGSAMPRKGRTLGCLNLFQMDASRKNLCRDESLQRCLMNENHRSYLGVPKHRLRTSSYAQSLQCDGSDILQKANSDVAECTARSNIGYRLFGEANSSCEVPYIQCRELSEPLEFR